MRVFLIISILASILLGQGIEANQRVGSSREIPYSKVIEFGEGSYGYRSHCFSSDAMPFTFAGRRCQQPTALDTLCSPSKSCIAISKKTDRVHSEENQISESTKAENTPNGKS